VVIGTRDKIDVFGTDYPTPDGTCVRDYIHVTDLANAHLKALQRMRNGGGSLVANCGYGRGFSVLDVLNTMKKVVGRDFNIGFGPRRAGDAVLIVANPAVAKRELGWQPVHDNLEEIISSALSWEEHLRKKNSY
jgi:UDP-glucose 4-epimerase